MYAEKKNNTIQKAEGEKPFKKNFNHGTYYWRAFIGRNFYEEFFTPVVNSLWGDPIGGLIAYSFNGEDYKQSARYFEKPQRFVNGFIKISKAENAKIAIFRGQGDLDRFMPKIVDADAGHTYYDWEKLAERFDGMIVYKPADWGQPINDEFHNKFFPIFGATCFYAFKRDAFTIIPFQPKQN